MRKDTPCPFVDHLETAHHARNSPLSSRFVDELHPVQREARACITTKDTRLEPVGQDGRSCRISIRAIALQWVVDIDNVRRRQCRIAGSFILTEDVIGGRGARCHVNVSREVDGMKSLEARHVPRVAGLTTMDKTKDSHPLPRTVLCDMDGVVWLAHHEIPGASRAVATLREAGVTVGFVTNNSFSTKADHERHLAAIGIECGDHLFTSAMAAATVIEPGMTVFLCGGRGLADEIERIGASVKFAHENRGFVGADAVVVGLHREMDYGTISDAARLVRSGALFVASNTDPMYPTPDGPMPGGGSVVAAIRTAAGRDPVVTGKPHQAMADLVTHSVGALDSRSWFVGDRHDTDGGFARRLGCRFAHVLSGTEIEPDPAADLVARDLAEVAELLTTP